MAKTYGVTDLAKRLDLEAASVRVGLRNRKVKKVDGAYSFTSGQVDDLVKAWAKDKPAAKKKVAKKSAKKVVKKAVVNKKKAKGNDDD